MAAQRDLYLQRGEDFQEYWSVADDLGVSLDLSGHDLALSVYDKLAGSTIAIGEVGVEDASTGGLDLWLSGSFLSDYGSPAQVFNLPYDFVATDQQGRKTVLVAGVLVLSRRGGL